MKPKTVFIPEADLRDLEELVRQKHYPNTSDAIRHAIKDLIRYHKEGEERK
jgi:Arc/MetJ-type ribon-helix-helix transcriptional regulator